jgi:predicted nucleic acid-binding protein
MFMSQFLANREGNAIPLYDHDQGYSFTDCTSFILMRELGLAEALTKDRHFEAAGCTALLK